MTNTILNIDAIEGMKLIPNKSIDMIFCDLPYQKTQNSWDVMISFEPMWEQFERIIKDNGAILLFGQDKFSAKLILSNEKMHRYNIIQNKVLPSGFLNAKKQPLRSHEDICVFYKKPCTYNPQMVKGNKCHSKSKAVGLQNSDVLDNQNYGDYKVVETEGDMKYPKSLRLFKSRIRQLQFTQRKSHLTYAAMQYVLTATRETQCLTAAAVQVQYLLLLRLKTEDILVWTMAFVKRRIANTTANRGLRQQQKGLWLIYTKSEKRFKERFDFSKMCAAKQ